MSTIKKKIRLYIEALLKIEKELEGIPMPPVTYSEFLNILKQTNADRGVISKWQKAQKKTGKPQRPDDKSLEIMYKLGIPLHWWFSIEDRIKKLKDNEVRLLSEEGGDK